MHGGRSKFVHLLACWLLTTVSCLHLFRWSSHIIHTPRAPAPCCRPSTSFTLHIYLFFDRPSFESVPSSSVLSRSLSFGSVSVNVPLCCFIIAPRRELYLIFICGASISLLVCTIWHENCFKNKLPECYFKYHGMKRLDWKGDIFPVNSAVRRLSSSGVIRMILMVSEERHFYQPWIMFGERRGKCTSAIGKGNAPNPCSKPGADEAPPCVWFTALLAVLCWYILVRTHTTAAHISQIFLMPSWW